MRTALRRRRRNIPILGSAAIVKYAYDSFNTNASAPLGSDAAEPGPGIGVTVDPNSRYSKNSGNLVGIPAGSGTFNTYRRYGPFALSRPQAVVGQVIALNNRIDIVAGNGTTTNQVPRIECVSPINMRGVNPGSVSTPHTISLPQPVAILRDLNGRVALFWNNRLYWVDEATDITSWNGLTGLQSSAAGGSLSDFQFLGLTSFWNDLYTVASVNVASPVAATNYTATANQVVRLTVTAPGVLAASAGLIFRGNATDGWRAYFDSAGAFKVARIVAGVEQAASVNVATVIAAGATVTINLTMDGNLINAHSIASGAPTNRGSQINNSHQASSTNLMVEVGAGWTVSNLRSWQVDASRYATDFAF